uniref:Uncharacterized protein, isoform A n=1 Tax=Drosophila pseudoobscura pseudoobscura TaxID=46245 RepID=A0A0R3NWT2_DROPS
MGQDGPSKRQRRKVAKLEEGNGQGRQIILVLNEESVRLLHDTEGTVDYGYKKVIIVEPPEIPSMEIKPVSVSDEASVVSDDILDGYVSDVSELIAAFGLYRAWRQLFFYYIA